MQPHNQRENEAAKVILDARRRPRFKMEVDITVHSRTCGVLTGHTADISESGIAAILWLEVPLGELVELEFTLPFGGVKILATARQRNAFRYGFQFAESNAIHQAIRDTCRHLAFERSLLGEL